MATVQHWLSSHPQSGIECRKHPGADYNFNLWNYAFVSATSHRWYWRLGGTVGHGDLAVERLVAAGGGTSLDPQRPIAGPGAGEEGNVSLAFGVLR